MITKKIQKILHKTVLLSLIVVFILPSSSISHASKNNPVQINAPAFLGENCIIPAGEGLFFQEDWEEIYSTLPVEDDNTVPWDIPDGQNPWSLDPNDWGTWQSVLAGSLQQNDSTPNHLSLLFETNRWMGDGIIETCFQFNEEFDNLIPGGVVFRYKDEDNFYGFGFLNTTTVALGKMEYGYPSKVTEVGGYNALQMNHVKIVLQGTSIKIYMNGSETPVISENISADPGMFGYGTYGSSADFGPIWADYDCSEAEADLSYIGQAVLAEVDTQLYCNNQYQALIKLPNVDTNEDGIMDNGVGAFTQFADLIKDANYEVSLTSMYWNQSMGNYILEGTDGPTSGLKALYESFMTDTANPPHYPQGMHVRILTGLNDRKNIKNALDLLSIPYHKFNPNGQEWILEIANYRGSFPTHSHVKTLIIDGKEVITAGYNVMNMYYAPVADMGIHISGPVAFESQRMFDALWQDADVYCDSEPCDWTTEEHPDYAPRPLSVVTAGNDNVFALFRDKDDKEADNAIAAALRSATTNINIIQQRFGTESISEQLPFAIALKDAISSNGDLQVKLLISGKGLTYLPGSDLYYSRAGVNALIKTLEGINRESQFKVKYYPGGVHTKALSIDGKFLIVGSQNWDSSAWGDGGMDLAEYSLGLDGGQEGTHPAIEDFDEFFYGSDGNSGKWSEGKDIPWIRQGDDIVSAISNTQSEDIVFVDDGSFDVAGPVSIDTPLTIVGGSTSSVIAFAASPPPTGDPEPLLRITSSDVAVVGFTFKDAPGYAIEIGDGSGTPLENIFISNVIFENNALGGIKINAPSDGSALTYHIENNVFMGGEVGILIDVAPAQAENSVVRNNIFTEQTTIPVEVISTDDGGVAYTYNLFDNCIRATDGICPSDWLTGTMNANSIAEQNIFNLSPAFSDAANGDYSLSAISPAIDAGDPAISYEAGALDGDEDGIVRIDMGAVEYFPDEANPRQLVLLSPQPGEIVGQVDPILSWEWAVESPPAPASYRVQASTDAQFLTTIVDEQAVTESTLQLPALTKGIYYWRVSPDAGTTWSLVRQFVISDPPVVSSITRADPNPTNVQSVDFTIVFSDDVTGVDASDFTLTTTGTISGASISEITGADATYTASVDTGTGEGTIRLDLIDDDTIANIYGMPLGGAGIVNGDYAAGEEYSVGPPPDNDDFDSPEDILALVYSHQMSTAYATTANDDPLVTACGIGQGQTTVWYSYTPSADSAISIDTFNADYDTFIAVWTGTRGDLTLIACNDDANETGQSALAFQVDQDMTYYIEIGQP